MRSLLDEHRFVRSEDEVWTLADDPDDDRVPDWGPGDRTAGDLTFRS